MTQVSSGTRRPLSDELVNRFSKDDRFIRPARRSFQVHDESERRITGQVPTPVDDEFRRSRVQVAFTEWRRIDGVEKLPQLCDAYLDDLTLRRNRIPRRRGLNRHQRSSIANRGQCDPFDDRKKLEAASVRVL
ncbi:MAG: hypothetical protein DMF89_26625 [Acidobacteria bacterium]|nr:MAG: hypothetical protein DMF89_26625 [Acidobacteriota bacterium]